MIEVYRIPIPKDRIRALPKDERVLLLLLGYVSNQVLMLQKLLIYSIRRTRWSSTRRACKPKCSCGSL